MDAQAQRIVDALTAMFPEVLAIYRFGSAERGDATASSDVDVAFLGPRPVDPVARWELEQRLAAELGRDVDLVDMRAATAVMRAQVLEHGAVLYERDPGERARFETRALAEYARLNEERRGILHDIAARGTVHG